MARHEKPPEGFAIAELPDGRYYPLEAFRLYSAAFPDGFLGLMTCGEVGGQPRTFTRYRAALDYCRTQARDREVSQDEHWQHLATKSDCYPERLPWYRDLIEEITGAAPLVDRWYANISVTAPGYFCDACRSYHPYVSTSALTIEDALAQAAEAVYASYARCCAGFAAEEGTRPEGERHAS